MVRQPHTTLQPEPIPSKFWHGRDRRWLWPGALMGRYSLTETRIRPSTSGTTTNRTIFRCGGIAPKSASYPGITHLVIWRLAADRMFASGTARPDQMDPREANPRCLRATRKT